MKNILAKKMKWFKFGIGINGNKKACEIIAGSFEYRFFADYPRSASIFSVSTFFGTAPTLLSTT
jgi:hypothetical protein